MVWYWMEDKSDDVAAADADDEVVEEEAEHDMRVRCVWLAWQHSRHSRWMFAEWVER